MKACFQIAECRFSSAKVMRICELECVKLIKKVAKFVISTFLALFVLLFELFLDIQSHTVPLLSTKMKEEAVFIR